MLYHALINRNKQKTNTTTTPSNTNITTINYYDQQHQPNNSTTKMGKDFMWWFRGVVGFALEVGFIICVIGDFVGLKFSIFLLQYTTHSTTLIQLTALNSTVTLNSSNSINCYTTLKSTRNALKSTQLKSSQLLHNAYQPEST